MLRTARVHLSLSEPFTLGHLIRTHISSPNLKHLSKSDRMEALRMREP